MSFVYILDKVSQLLPRDFWAKFELLTGFELILPRPSGLGFWVGLCVCGAPGARPIETEFSEPSPLGAGFRRLGGRGSKAKAESGKANASGARVPDPGKPVA